ncbi:MAG: sugar kinase [Chloroflexota bacterium]
MPRPRFDLTTFGEGGLRLSVPVGERLEVAAKLDVNLAGAEANVACALSRLGHNCGWISGLPNSALGRRVANEYRQHGLDMSAVVWSDSGRLSTYFVEYATAPRPIQVFFDRKDSCFTKLSPDQIDWDYLLDTRLIHLTGITVPLSPSCTQIVTEAIKRAKSANVPISFDVNYRSLLWKSVNAAQILQPLIRGIELLFCSHRDAVELFGCMGECEESLTKLAEQTGAKQVVMSSGEDGLYGWRDGKILFEPAQPVVMVDRLGAGDGMAAGVIHGWLDGDFAKGVKYSAAMAALALSQQGEQVMTTVAELDSLLAEGRLMLSR